MTSHPAVAFDALVARHERDVLRVCCSILRDEHLGRDAAQETFLRLWRRVREGREIERPPSWLRRVAVHTAIDLSRRRAARGRENGFEADDVAGAEPAGPAAISTVTTACAAVDFELQACFEAALAELPEGQRTVFELRHDGDLSLSEIAESLDLALPTVKTQFARACLKLQQKLAAFRPDLEDHR